VVDDSLCLQLIADGILTWTDVTEKMSIDDVDKVAIMVEALNVARKPPPTSGSR
jgi:hypothetical protein